MDQKILDYTWIKLQKIYHSIRKKVLTNDMKYFIGNGKSEILLLTAYLSFARSYQGCDITVDVGIRLEGTKLIFEADIISDYDGSIIATGPERVFDAGIEPDRATLDAWLHDVATFLDAHCDQIRASVLALPE